MAYLTQADLAPLDPSTDLPPRKKGSDMPILESDGTVILLLFAADYSYDDLVGEKHESTAITAEKKLVRDVRDFLVAAHSRKELQ